MAGSSPLTRGALERLAVLIDDSGLIPAHAGSTLQAMLALEPVAAHPRSRGEHALSATKYGVGMGSSPLTRGALIQTD